jgi:hypothetical protein
MNKEGRLKIKEQKQMGVGGKKSFEECNVGFVFVRNVPCIPTDVLE